MKSITTGKRGRKLLITSKIEQKSNSGGQLLVSAMDLVKENSEDVGNWKQHSLTVHGSGCQEAIVDQPAVCSWGQLQWFSLIVSDKMRQSQQTNEMWQRMLAATLTTKGSSWDQFFSLKINGDVRDGWWWWWVVVGYEKRTKGATADLGFEGVCARNKKREGKRGIKIERLRVIDSVGWSKRKMNYTKVKLW